MDYYEDDPLENLSDEEIKHLDKLAMFIFGSLKHLEDYMGLIPGQWQISPLGISEYDQLVSEGFKPLNEEIFAYMIGIHTIEPKSFTTIFTLITELRDLGPLKFEEKWRTYSESIDSGDSDDDSLN